MYHRINYDKGLLSVSPEKFRKQMDFLKRNNFRVITLEELVEGIKSKKEFLHKEVVITFDDGYRDNFIYAYPILKEYGFPAIIFLITGKIGKDENYLDWEEIKEMLKGGISFGGHTRNHIYLPSLENDEGKLWDEIWGCKEDIENNLGIKVKYLAYPVGGFSEKIKEFVKKAGYDAGLTTNRGKDLRNLKDVYELNRISVRDKSILEFWIKVSGYYNIFRKKKSVY